MAFREFNPDATLWQRLFCLGLPSPNNGRFHDPSLAAKARQEPAFSGPLLAQAAANVTRCAVAVNESDR